MIDFAHFEPQRHQRPPPAVEKRELTPPAIGQQQARQHGADDLPAHQGEQHLLLG
jgi:hypothetical protein